MASQQHLRGHSFTYGDPMQFHLLYVSRRLVSRTEEVRVAARSRDEAIAAGNSLMERYGFNLKQFRKPQVRPIK